MQPLRLQHSPHMYLLLTRTIEETAQNAITSPLPRERKKRNGHQSSRAMSLRQSWRCASRSEVNASHPHRGVKSDLDCSARSRNVL